MPLSPGYLLNNRYRIENLLGQGGFGAVYRALDTNLDRPCAIKENLDASPEAERQFKREAKLLVELVHPNLPRVFDTFLISAQGQYLVMDYVEGEDLERKLLKSGEPLSEAQALAYIIQVCDALTYLHSLHPPIIHRDLKPANIRITTPMAGKPAPGDLLRFGKAVLVDFGIAKLYDPGLKTTVGARAVTPGYSPPEQYGMGATDARTDVYALGATLYHLVTGQAPPESIQRSLGVPLSAPHLLNPHLTEAVERLILKSIELLPEGRFSSAAQLKEALLSAFHSLEAQKPASLPMVSADEPSPLVFQISNPPPIERTLQVSPVSAALLPPQPGSVRSFQGAAASQQSMPVVESPPLRRLPLWLLLSALAIPLILAISLGVYWFNSRTPASAAPTVSVAAPIPATSLPATAALPATNSSPGTTVSTETLEPDVLVATETSALFTDSAGVEMVLVPAGDFLMGSADSDSAANSDEKPQHVVSLSEYYIDKTEVTNNSYARCVEAGACSAPANTYAYSIKNYYGNPDYDAYPVIWVEWRFAKSYCEWRGARLPTEAEWEKAARGADARLFPWGDAFDNTRANLCDKDCPLPGGGSRPWNDGFPLISSVGSFADGASPFGALDLAGNVWEWVADWYQEDYYSSSPSKNPLGPQTGLYRVVRGGSWGYAESFLRNSQRRRVGISYRDVDIGFRCVLTPPTPAP